jgi:hypothetical protein
MVGLADEDPPTIKTKCNHRKNTKQSGGDDEIYESR